MTEITLAPSALQPQSQRQSTARPLVGSRGLFRAFVADKAGATAIEYALIAGLIALAIIPAMSAVGLNNGGMWTRIGKNVEAATQ
jgi:pilus assembly protein Flp/PilA